MALHEVITCDVCNEDGEIPGHSDSFAVDDPKGVFFGNAEQAEAEGWLVDEGDPFVEHMCPACRDEGDEEGDDDAQEDPDGR